MDIDLTDDPFCHLTIREREVAVAIAQGLNNHEIAAQMGISVKTVDTHRGKVIKKTGARNNVELARKAIKYGLAQLCG